MHPKKMKQRSQPKKTWDKEKRHLRKRTAVALAVADLPTATVRNDAKRLPCCTAYQDCCSLSAPPPVHLKTSSTPQTAHPTAPDPALPHSTAAAARCCSCGH